MRGALLVKSLPLSVVGELVRVRDGNARLDFVHDAASMGCSQLHSFLHELQALFTERRRDGFGDLEQFGQQLDNRFQRFLVSNAPLLGEVLYPFE